MLSDAHSRYGFCAKNKQTRSVQKNKECERFLEFAIANGLCVSNTWFRKRDSHLITYCSSSDSTKIDYIFCYKSSCSAVSNMKVIPNKERSKQHHMVMCYFTVHTPHVKKCNFSSCICTWKLRDPATARQLQSAFKVKTMTVVAAVSTTVGTDADTANCVESAW